MSKKVLFCGGGNMGEGILKGLIANEAADKQNITINELNPQRRDYLSETYEVSVVEDATDAMKEADLIIIAVNPHQVGSVTSNLKSLINENTIVLSIAAGITIESLENQLGSDKKILRVMPNTLIQSGNGHSAACINSNINDDDKTFITKILNALGQTMFINEDMFDTFTAFSCSGPLWLYKTVEALINAGVYSGFSRADARKIVIRNMMGVSQVLEESGEHPSVKIDEMCSPGGVTIEALKMIEDQGIASGFMASVDIAVKKANSIK
ncbi:pyrroline-5-carboxylate reductase [Enterococcus sp. DIV0187]|uniref:pyrroline-5-carboxylate reductase n=1 Tax=Enterococcus sp. DIV0187 TaxID=2774644 RepID=UPI003F1F0FF8